jgi:hypothetical protein
MSISLYVNAVMQLFPTKTKTKYSKQTSGDILSQQQPMKMIKCNARNCKPFPYFLQHHQYLHPRHHLHPHHH